MNDFFNDIKDSAQRMIKALTDKRKERKDRKEKERSERPPPVNIRTVAAQNAQLNFQINELKRSLDEVGAMVELLLNCKFVQVDHINSVHKEAKRVKQMEERAQQIAHSNLTILQEKRKDANIPITQQEYNEIMVKARVQAKNEFDPPEGSPPPLPDDIEEAKRKFEEAKKERLKQMEEETAKEQETKKESKPEKDPKPSPELIIKGKGKRTRKITPRKTEDSSEKKPT